MSAPTPKQDQDDFAAQGAAPRASFLAEYTHFLRSTRKWWLLPLLIFLGVFGLLLLLASTGAAPFLYTLF